MIQFYDKLSEALIKVFQLPEDEVKSAIEIPPDPEKGDLALPCFRFAKAMHKAPQQIAIDIAEHFPKDVGFERIEAAGPYVNFFYDRSVLLRTVSETIDEQGDRYGASDIGKGKTNVIDFSSTNIAKPFHIGHLRSTIIGDALYRISKRLGYRTIGVNHLGDYGTQFGMLISAYKKWGDRDAIEENPIDEFLKLYVRYNTEAEEHPELRKEALDWFKKLEENDPEARTIWQWMRDLSLQEFNKVYERLGVHFDSYNGEAFYQDKMEDVIETMREKNLLKLDDGCEIVDLSEDDMVPLIVRKSNGTSTYATRDIACAVYRKNTYDFDSNIYVVATEQNLHFRQFFKTLELMGYPWAKDMKHVAFGMVSVEGGALSTRKGQVLYLSDVIQKAVDMTKRIIEERNPDLPEKDRVAEQVGIGAIRFQELYNQRIKDYVFQWERTLSFEGETGPYVQYTYARICSLIEKSGRTPSIRDLDVNLLNDDELILLKSLYRIPNGVVEAFKKFEPYFISRNVMDLARNFNRYYYNHHILNDDPRSTAHRVAMADLVRKAIRSQLSLLGIETPERM